MADTSCGRRRRDLRRNEFGVVFHPSEERRPSGVLPRQAEEVEARDICNSTAVDGAAGGVEHWEIDPRVIRAIPSCPDHAVDVDLAAVCEVDRAVGHANDSRLQLDAVTPRHAAWAR